jgi:hypothetical protein
MAYTALFQGHAVRFVEPGKGASSCALMLDDVVSIFEALGVDPGFLTAGQGRGAVDHIGFGALVQWIEEIRAGGHAAVSMFLHWLLRHMPNAQVALGLPLLGYLQSTGATRQVRRRAA